MDWDWRSTEKLMQDRAIPEKKPPQREQKIKAE